MQRVTYKITPDPAKNSIGYSKNYRIFTTGEPIRKAIRLIQPIGYKEELELGSAIGSNITRKFRYSTNRSDWSLWYQFTLTDFSELYSLEFEESDIFIELKYEYDDGTFDQLSEPLLIEWIKLFIQTNQNQGEDYEPPVQCSEELCPMLIAEKDALFKPYDASTAIGIAHELSLQTNKIFGHEVVYFKTEPDRDAADFIFKEWTLFKTTIRKCVKVMVPENKFPDNKPMFTEFGVDFEIPFEIHIDNVYFQQMFGRNSQPRKRDYLFFPLLNRMYEIQGSYLYRGFMMEPMYWKIQLTKFHPNIDMYMKPENRQFLDNLIMSSDQLYGNEAANQTLDALDPQQTKTISNKFDESRKALHRDLKNKIHDFTFNYAPLIEYYYDMSAIDFRSVTYRLEAFSSTDVKKTQTLSTTSPFEIFAYEDSDIFGAWNANELSTYDSNVKSGSPSVTIKMNGPKDSYSPFGKYVLVEGYKNLGLKENARSNIQINETDNTVQFIQHENAVVYKKIASTTDLPSMTFATMINFTRGTQDITFFKGFDDYLQKGLVIRGRLVDVDGSTASLTVYVQINDTVHEFILNSSTQRIEYGKWYSLIVPVSSQYGQVSINVYTLGQDPANIKNFNRVIRVFSEYRKIGQFEFETTANYCLPSAKYKVANVRLFNTMVQDEDHEFIISQLFIRDESTLAIIDNARPRLNAPFVAINR